MEQNRRGFLALLASIVAAPAAAAVQANQDQKLLDSLKAIKKFAEVTATARSGTAGQVLVSDGKGGVEWRDPEPQVGRGLKSPSYYMADESGFMEYRDGKLVPVYILSPGGRAP